MTRCLPRWLLFAIAVLPACPAVAVTNLLSNPGFLDINLDGLFGDDWSHLINTDFNAFFGAANPHASLFADDSHNLGFVDQFGIPGVPGQSYQFDLINVRIEQNWDADLYFGVEYYGADQFELLGETFEPIDTAARLALPNVDGDGAVNGAVFSMRGTAVPGTVFVRPVIKFDHVNDTYQSGVTQQANAFVFNSFLSESPEMGDEYLKNPSFGDEDADGNLGDFWGSYGAAGFHDFFGGNPHASLFADQPGNFGGIFQQSILGSAGEVFEFSLNDVRIEQNAAAHFRFGLEYYGDDDFHSLGETLIQLDTSVTGDGLSFVMTGTAVPGTKYVRPVVLFDDVTSTATEQESVFIFDASLTKIGDASSIDFDHNGVVDGDDIDALVMEIVQGTHEDLFDLTGDGFVDGDDLGRWLVDAGAVNLASGKPYIVGDANLDGNVDVSDFNAWNGAKFTSTAAWTQGDFNADGVSDVSDFNLWNGRKFTSALTALPEPGAWFLALCSLAVISARTGRRAR